MERETFKMRKQFLEEFYNEDRVKFLNACKNIYIKNNHLVNSIHNNNFSIETEPIFRLSVVNMVKIVCNCLKPFIYFLYSITRYTKFLPDKLLFFSNLDIRYGKGINNENEMGNYTVYFSISNGIIPPDYEDFNFLKCIKLKDFLNESVKEIIYLSMKLNTNYYNINYNQYITLGGIIEDINDNEDVEDATNKIINSSQTFKSEECVICLTNQPNVLFCNCGHLCYCSECEKLKISNKCPICKIENRIIRVLEL